MNPPTSCEESMDCGVGMDSIAREQVGDEEKLQEKKMGNSRKIIFVTLNLANIGNIYKQNRRSHSCWK